MNEILPATERLYSQFDDHGNLTTNFERWRAIGTEDAKWDSRYKAITRYIRPFDRVLELGCGSERLKRHLPVGCRYLPSDIIQRSANCLVIDLNATVLAPLDDNHDVCVMAGVLEYVRDVDAIFTWLVARVDAIVFSYATVDQFPDLEKRNSVYGWFSHHSHEAVLAIAARRGLHCAQVSAWHRHGIYYARRWPKDEGGRAEAALATLLARDPSGA